MSVWLIAAVVVVAAFVIVGVLLPRQKRPPSGSGRITEVRHGGGGSGGSDEREGMQSIGPELRRRIARILAKDGKIAAIKEFRDATGWGLKESKDFVEALGPEDALSGPDSHGADFEELGSTAKDIGLDDLDREGLERVMEDIRHGRKINAIKELRAMTGLGLKESKDLVDEIERTGLHL